MSEHHTDNATPQLSVTQSLGDLNRQDRTNLDRGLALGVRVYTILVVLTGLTWPVGNVLGMKLFSHPAMFVWMQLLLLFSVLLDYFYHHSDTPFRGLPWNGKDVSRLIEAASQSPDSGEQAYTAWFELNYLSKKLRPRHRKHFSKESISCLNKLLVSQTRPDRLEVLVRLAEIAGNRALLVRLDDLAARVDSVDPGGNLAIQVKLAIAECRQTERMPNSRIGGA
ncbi:hypothetical protein MCEMSE15_00223 [Fimbriimonadaceae bacterium]